jgi:hypothetical protein
MESLIESKTPFKVIGNNNSHNYSSYVDKNGEVVFNNTRENIYITDNHLESGVRGGNNIRYTDLYPVIAIRKKDIIKSLGDIEKQIKEILKTKEELNKKLHLMTTLNVDEISHKYYKKYVIESITGTKIPEKTD